MLCRKHFTLVEIMIVIAIIAILTIVAVPGFRAARRRSNEKACIINLKQIEAALVNYQIFNPGVYPANMADLVTSGELRLEPKCSAGGGAVYTVPAEGDRPACPVVAACPTHILP